MRRRRSTAAAAACAGIAGVVAVPALASTRSVKVGDNYFVHDGGVPTVSVKHGTTVKWAFAGNSAYNVTVTSGPKRFHSASLTQGSFARKLVKRGTYRIVCTIHGARDMSMVLRVT